MAENFDLKSSNFFLLKITFKNLNEGLREKPAVLQIEHPALQGTKFLYFHSIEATFAFLCASKRPHGSDWIRIHSRFGSNPDWDQFRILNTDGKHTCRKRDPGRGLACCPALDSTSSVCIFASRGSSGSFAQKTS